MRLLCSTCERHAAIASFRVDQGRLLLTCARCGQEGEAELAEPAAAVQAPAPSRVVALRPVNDAVRLAAEAACSPAPFAVPVDRCPKCVGERPAQAPFCPHCGLTYVNFQPEHVAPSKELEQAFRCALEQWDDPLRQDAALALATRTGELPALGRLYRLRLVAAPTDPVAQRGREEVLRRAAATSEVMRVQQHRESRLSWRRAALGLAILLAVLGLIAGVGALR